MLKKIPRLPLSGELDLTYRCNNQCRHCWLWLPHDAPQQNGELSFDEIRRIADESRALGCRHWSISGGEPMLRPDFPEIFDYLTRKGRSYSLNTNGTLITPEIARLLTRKGNKMVALYGATGEVYDDVTRNPGGFEAVMRGIEKLREAGAGFTVQLIPMRANFHQWDRMVTLAKSLSDRWRIGAAWLFLSREGKPARNREIAGQRLSPKDVIKLDQPDPTYGERMAELAAMDPQNAGHDLFCGAVSDGDDRLFARCIAGRQNFHIDPYGRMSWCSRIADPALRYDLRRGTVRDAWDEFIPLCAENVRGDDEWHKHCRSCERCSDCRWCAAYARLETGSYSAPVPYFCAVSDEARKFKKEWQSQHRRYFQIAGITVRIESELDFDRVKFKDEFLPFMVDGPGRDNVTISHCFEMPDLKGKGLGKELYRRPPWVISRDNGTWFYRCISSIPGDRQLYRVAVFNHDYSRATIYSPASDLDHVRANGWHSLSLFPTDQIWLAPLLADRNAVLLHSAAAILNGRGLIFVGHSEAGKSTTMEMLKAARSAPPGENGSGRPRLPWEILCDDRNIVRKWPGQWRVHGTWSHGTTADVSGASAPLQAILFLQQSTVNEITPLADRKSIWPRLLGTVVRPMLTQEWWNKELDVLQQIVNEVPCYQMRFDRSGAIVAQLARLTGTHEV